MLTTLRDTVSASLVERDREVEALLLGLVSRQHVLLVGPPGTAKSLICRSLAACIHGCRFVERLLSPDVDPDYVWGPIDPVQYRERGRYVRRLDGYAAAAELLFLDEVSRASDMIRDTLLHLLGPERQTLIDGEQVSAPLVCAVGATNAWPEPADQAAFLDRWLIRLEVRPVSPQGEERLMFEELPGVWPVCDLVDVLAAVAVAEALELSEEARAALIQIRDELRAAGIIPSNRRLRQSVGVARAAAAIEGAGEVAPHHLECLGMVLWDDPHEQPQKAADIVCRIANPIGARLNELLREVDEAVAGATDSDGRLKAIKQLEANEREASKLSAGGNGRAKATASYIRRERVRLQAAAMGIDPQKAMALLGGES